MGQDANGAPTDALPEEGQPSEEAAQEPSGEMDTVTVFTKEDVLAFAEDYANKKHSSLDKQIAELKRLANLGALAGQQLAQTQDRISELEAQIDGAQGEASKYDADMMDGVQFKKQAKAELRQLTEDRSKLNWEKLAWADSLKKIEEYELREQATAIASKYKIDAADILSLNPDSVEQMELFAEKLAKVSGIAATKVSKPDSALGVGASVNLDDMTAEDKILYAIEHPKKKTS